MSVPCVPLNFSPGVTGAHIIDVLPLQLFYRMRQCNSKAMNDVAGR